MEYGKASKLKLWLRPEPEVSKELANEISVAKNGYIAIGSAFVGRIDKHANFMYGEDGMIGIRPVKEKNRNSYTVSHLTGRASCIINASALVIQLDIKPGRYKATWENEINLLLFRAKLDKN